MVFGENAWIKLELGVLNKFIFLNKIIFKYKYIRRISWMYLNTYP